MIYNTTNITEFIKIHCFCLLMLFSLHNNVTSWRTVIKEVAFVKGNFYKTRQKVILRHTVELFFKILSSLKLKF